MLNHCLKLFPLFVGVLCLVLVLLCGTCCPFWFCSRLGGVGAVQIV